MTLSVETQFFFFSNDLNFSKLPMYISQKAKNKPKAMFRNI